MQSALDRLRLVELGWQRTCQATRPETDIAGRVWIPHKWRFSLAAEWIDTRQKSEGTSLTG